MHFLSQMQKRHNPIIIHKLSTLIPFLIQFNKETKLSPYVIWIGAHLYNVTYEYVCVEHWIKYINMHCITVALFDSTWMQLILLHMLTYILFFLHCKIYRYMLNKCLDVRQYIAIFNAMSAFASAVSMSLVV